jgi:membrane peptidoglycan carboxypeptidase
VVALAAAWFLASSWRTARSLRAEARTLLAGGLAPSGLPAPWIDWLLRVEDPAFRTHPGVDLTTPGAGWTTLTQGLVKIHFPGPHRGPLGKPVQTLRALVLDAVTSKDEQLALMLDSAYFGEGENGPLVGFEAAARAIYGRPLVELRDEHFLGLVAMLIGPNRYHPLRRPREHEVRLRRIQALVAGRCRPAAWGDVELAGCAGAAGHRPHPEPPRRSGA